VTGSGRGIGHAIALGFAAEAAAVFLVGRTRERLEDTAASIRARGGVAHPVVCDVSDERAVRALADTVSAEAGRLDVLVNCAALRMHQLGDPTAYRKPTVDVTVEEWDRVMGTNVRGPFLLARALFPLLRAAGRASVIDVSAGAATSGEGGRAPYAASKAGLEALSRTLASEWRDAGIAVNVLVPDARVVHEDHVRGVREPTAGARYVVPETLVPPAIHLATSGVSGQRILALAWNAANGFGGWERWEAR